jgi:hypothetical protein
VIKIVEAHSAERKTQMNPSMDTQEISVPAANGEPVPAEQELLAQWGFTAEESASLLWLRQWYQTGGSDRAAVVRYLEFLRLLVRNGELEL